MLRVDGKTNVLPKVYGRNILLRFSLPPYLTGKTLRVEAALQLREHPGKSLNQETDKTRI